MRFPISSITLSDFEDRSTLGSADLSVRFMSSLSHADEHCLSFYSGDDQQRLEAIECGILIVDEAFLGRVSDFRSKGLVFSSNPKYEFLKVLEEKFDDVFTDQLMGDVPEANVSEHAYVEKGAVIGLGSTIFPNAVVHRCVELGSRCIVQSGTVLGGSGLGDVFFEGKYRRFVHVGGLRIGANVSFGTNNSIVRGMLEDTVIGSGTKIGNNVNIGHSCVIGRNVYISSGVTIAGACVIADGSWLGPGVTLTDHVTVAENTMIGTGAVLVNDALRDSFYLGNPARKLSARK